MSETLLSALHNYTLIWATVHFVVTGHVFFSTQKFPFGQSFFFLIWRHARMFGYLFFLTQFAFFNGTEMQKNTTF